jgi:hypothetical protein
MNPHVGVQVREQVVVRRREEETDFRSRAELADVERQDFGQRAIENGTKLVSHDESAALRLRDREGEAKTVPLAVRQFGGRAEE